MPVIITHELKVWSEFFEDVANGIKPFEVRKDDRNYQVGDVLKLSEYALGGDGMTEYDLTRHYTGRSTTKLVTYILKGGQFGIEEGYVVMGIKEI